MVNKYHEYIKCIKCGKLITKSIGYSKKDGYICHTCWCWLNYVVKEFFHTFHSLQIVFRCIDSNRCEKIRKSIQKRIKTISKLDKEVMKELGKLGKNIQIEVYIKNNKIVD